MATCSGAVRCLTDELILPGKNNLIQGYINRGVPGSRDTYQHQLGLLQKSRAVERGGEGGDQLGCGQRMPSQRLQARGFCSALALALTERPALSSTSAEALQLRADQPDLPVATAVHLHDEFTLNLRRGRAVQNALRRWGRRRQRAQQQPAQEVSSGMNSFL
jgi:hypothetical protein